MYFSHVNQTTPRPLGASLVPLVFSLARPTCIPSDPFALPTQLFHFSIHFHSFLCLLGTLYAYLG